MGLVKKGADFVAIDKVMEKFGMPMGPAYLCDVVGIDTGVHAGKVMSEGIPERMSRDFKTVSEVLYEENRYGQKNGKGYFSYELDKKGRSKKVVDESVYELFAPHCDARKEFTEEEIIETAKMSLASYQKPRTVEFVEALPKASTGKILKRVLRDPQWVGTGREV